MRYFPFVIPHDTAEHLICLEFNGCVTDAEAEAKIRRWLYTHRRTGKRWHRYGNEFYEGFTNKLLGKIEIEQP